MPYTSFEQKSARERYIRVAAIDIVTSEGIKNIILNASFRSKEMNTTGRNSIVVKSKSQMTPYCMEITSAEGENHSVAKPPPHYLFPKQSSQSKSAYTANAHAK
jgi:hypothetical protein